MFEEGVLTRLVFDVKSYGGTKNLLISTRTVMGGKNNFLGIAYIVVGGLCIVLGVLFTVAHLIKPRYVRCFKNRHRCLTVIENLVITPTYHGTTIQRQRRPQPAVIQGDKIVMIICMTGSIGVWRRLQRGSAFSARLGHYTALLRFSSHDLAKVCTLRSESIFRLGGLPILITVDITTVDPGHSPA